MFYDILGTEPDNMFEITCLKKQNDIAELTSFKVKLIFCKLQRLN